MKKRVLIAICCLLLASVLLMSGCTLFDYGDDDTDVPLSTPLSIKYTEYSAIKGNISKSITTTVEIVSHKSEKYAFEEKQFGGGKATTFGTFNVKVGTAVKKGDVLCTSSSGVELKSGIDGVVRFVNSQYTNLKTPDKQIEFGKTMVAVNNEDLSNAYGVFTVDRNELRGYSLGIGSKVTMKKISASPQTTEKYEGVIIGSSEGFTDENMERPTYYEFNVSLENIPDDVKVGDRLSLTYLEAEAKDAILVPASAVYTYAGRSFVYVLDSQGIKRENYVEAGLSDGIMTEIKSGLKLNQRIIQY